MWGSTAVRNACEMVQYMEKAAVPGNVFPPLVRVIIVHGDVVERAQTLGLVLRPENRYWGM